MGAVGVARGLAERDAHGLAPSPGTSMNADPLGTAVGTVALMVGPAAAPAAAADTDGLPVSMPLNPGLDDLDDDGLDDGRLNDGVATPGTLVAAKFGA